MSAKFARVRCSVCDKETAARLPPGGDGSALFPRRHVPARAGAPTRPDGACRGCDEAALSVEISTLQDWASAIERPADKGGNALRSALRTLRGLPPTPHKAAPDVFARLRAWRDELAASPAGSPGRFIAAEIERRFPEAFDEEETP